MKKKLVATILAVLGVIACALSLTACGEVKEVVYDKLEDFSYYEEDGELFVTGFKNKPNDVDFKKVVFPEGVTIIMDEAFCGTEVRTVVIPSSVKTVGRRAFAGCQSLTNLTVESGNSVYHSSGNCLIETESKKLVQGCGKNSTIPSDGSVTTIGQFAFERFAFDSVTIPKSITEIEYKAFDLCHNLVKINYKGTTGEWKAITKGISWDNGTGQYTVYCSNDNISKS